jgi:hypothetical protein
MTTNRETALRNLLRSQPGLRRGGLQDIVRVIDRDGGPPGYRPPCLSDFVPSAMRWDGNARTVHLYEISSSEAFPDGTFDAIKEFAEWLHDSMGCFTVIWIADGNGHDPMKVWDVRDELMWAK